MLHMLSWIIVLAAIVFAAVYFGDGKFRTVKKANDPSPDPFKHRHAKDEVNEEGCGESKAVLEREENYS